MTNRFSAYSADIAKRLSTVTADKLERMKASTADVTWAELVAYQTKQAELRAGERINLEEAMWLYTKLGGESPTVAAWRTIDLADQITITKLMEEVLRPAAKARRAS